MDRRTFQSNLANSATMAFDLAKILSKRLRLANAHLLSVASLDVPGRVAAQLVALAREYGEEIPEGAHTHAAHPERPGRPGRRLAGEGHQALGFFRKRGAISVGEDDRITVLDEEALARRAR